MKRLQSEVKAASEKQQTNAHHRENGGERWWRRRRRMETNGEKAPGKGAKGQPDVTAGIKHSYTLGLPT